VVIAVLDHSAFERREDKEANIQYVSITLRKIWTVSQPCSEVEPLIWNKSGSGSKKEGVSLSTETLHWVPSEARRGSRNRWTQMPVPIIIKHPAPDARVNQLLS